MEFVKYPKIANVYSNGVINSIRLHDLDKNVEWVVTEKIHGANVSFISDGKQVQAARRTGFIGEHESFFNVSEIQNNYKNNFVNLARELLAAGPGTVRVYAEIYGGCYPHPRVAPHQDSKQVQKGS